MSTRTQVCSKNVPPPKHSTAIRAGQSAHSRQCSLMAATAHMQTTSICARGRLRTLSHPATHTAAAASPGTCTVLQHVAEMRQHHRPPSILVLSHPMQASCYPTPATLSHPLVLKLSTKLEPDAGQLNDAHPSHRSLQAALPLFMNSTTDATDAHAPKPHAPKPSQLLRPAAAVIRPTSQHPLLAAAAVACAT
jgi:hypothetical protein